MKHLKHFLTMLLLLYSTVAKSYDFNSGGFYYNITDETAKTVEVTYGEYDYFGDDIEIPATVVYNGTKYSVKSIGNRAFYKAPVLSIKIPNSVTTIGEYAFYSTLVSSIEFSNSITTIGEYAFADCQNLTSIEIPNSVTSIGSSAFFYNCNLTSIKIGDNIRSIGVHAFDETRWLNNHPDTVVYLGKYLYKCRIRYNNYDKDIPDTHLTVKEGTLIIADQALYHCNNLESIIIPNSLKSLGKYNFSTCNLREITIGSGLQSCHADMFKGNSNLKKVNINDLSAWCNIDFENYYANPLCNGGQLYLNGELVSGDLVIPDGVKEIKNAFLNCSQLTSVTIPNSVTSIGANAFYGCSQLTSVTIPNSVTSIGAKAFSVRKVNISDIMAWCNIDFENQNASPFYHGNSNLYLNGELVTTLFIPEGVTEIKKYAFYNLSGLRNIVLPKSLTNIAEQAFYSATDNLFTIVNLSSIVLTKDSWDYDAIARYADIVVNDPNATFVGDFVFSKINGVNTLVAYLGNATEVVLPEDCNGESYCIGEYVFKGNVGLTSITIPDSVTAIGSSAIEGCSSITSIIIPNSVTSIGDSAFKGCTGLTDLILGRNVSAIGQSVFSDCKNLKSVVSFSTLLNDSNSYIYFPYSIKFVYAPNGTIVEDFVFCTLDSVQTLAGYLGSASEIVLPDNYNDESYSIGYGAFKGYKNLKTISIPNSVTGIGNYAFSGCSSISNITIPDSVSIIGNNAFEGCI